MSYTALYRKYRPQTFSQVKGQEHIVTALGNQIAAGRIAHAYVFCGTRGTGKTSVAKIFAKAVNCEHPDEKGNPCGECPSCRAIADGSAMNVIEIDAASNNGIENMRLIREEVAYPPTDGKYKVYIIDEAHQITQSAFNALLKTLEEPPSYVIFILATTDVNRIPITILSRCQRYDFHRILQGEIVEQLHALMEQENVEAEEKALQFIARKADGGMRDALSLADQCISFYLGQPLTYDNVVRVLGALDVEQLDSLFRAVYEGDVGASFRMLEKMISSGKDLLQLVTDLTQHMRNILLLQVSNDAEDMIEVSSEDMKLLRTDAQMVSAGALIRYIRVLSELSNQMRFASNKRILLEVALIRLARPQMEADQQSILERLRVLEEAAANGTLAAPVERTAGKTPAPAVAKPARVHQKAVPEDLQRISREWRSITEGIQDRLLRSTLASAELSFDPRDGHEGEIYVVMYEITGSQYAGDEASEAICERAVEDKIGKVIAVHLVNGSGGEQNAQLQKIQAIEEAAGMINMDIDIAAYGDPDDF